MPIISACGIETCILPSAVLSTHTGGFSGYTFRDLTDDMPLIARHWLKEGISFDALYTGYLGSEKQIDYVKDIQKSLIKKGGITIVDPACADNGMLYYGFGEHFVKKMASLIAVSDIALPNITEASMLTGEEFKTEYDESYIDRLTDKVLALGAKSIVLTGVSYDENSTGVYVKTDVYASAFSGMLLHGKTIEEAARIAADFTLLAIENTVGDENHRYGVKFEKGLGYLIKQI